MSDSIQLELKCGCKFSMDSQVYDMLGTFTSFRTLRDYMKDHNILKEGVCQQCHTVLESSHDRLNRASHT